MLKLTKERQIYLLLLLVLLYSILLGPFLLTANSFSFIVMGLILGTGLLVFAYHIFSHRK